MVNPKDFKIRCSAIHKIMSASGKIIDGNKEYCKDWLIEKLYGRPNLKVSSLPHVKKGHKVEDKAIAFLEQQGYSFMLEKNKEHFEDDYFTGTPDLLLPGEVWDIKNAEDCYTFPLFEKGKSIPTKYKKYNEQLQGYMHLTGRTKARLVYMLMDTPDNLKSWTEREELPNYTYDSVDPALRVKIFETTYDPAFIESVKVKVDMCREYIQTLIEQL